MSVAKTIRVWGDTARRKAGQPCREPRCQVPLWFVETVASGKKIPLDTEPVALKTELDADTGRLIWHVDASDVHFTRCVGATQFRRDR